jgi:hypothetical protein
LNTNRTQPIIEGIFTLLAKFWAERRRLQHHKQHALLPLSPTRATKTATLGELGTAAVAEARRRIDAALAASYGPSTTTGGAAAAAAEEEVKKEQQQQQQGGNGGVGFWELPRLLGLRWGDGEGAGGVGKAWDLQGTYD